MSRCARAPHLAQCPGYPQFEFDSLSGLSGYNMPIEEDLVLGGRRQIYTSQYPGISDLLSRQGLGGMWEDTTGTLLWIAVAFLLYFHYKTYTKKRKPKGTLTLKSVAVI